MTTRAIRADSGGHLTPGGHRPDEPRVAAEERPAMMDQSRPARRRAMFPGKLPDGERVRVGAGSACRRVGAGDRPAPDRAGGTFGRDRRRLPGHGDEFRRACRGSRHRSGRGPHAPHRRRETPRSRLAAGGGGADLRADESGPQAARPGTHRHRPPPAAGPPPGRRGRGPDSRPAGRRNADHRDPRAAEHPSGLGGSGALAAGRRFARGPHLLGADHGYRRRPLPKGTSCCGASAATSRSAASAVTISGRKP